MCVRVRLCVRVRVGLRVWVKGKLRLMVRVRVSHDNSSDKRSKKMFFFTNMTIWG